MEENNNRNNNNNGDFKGRIDKVFGALFELSSDKGNGWRLSDDKLQKREWKREEYATSREDTPCGSSFQGLLGPRRSGVRNSSSSAWEGNFDSDDDEGGAGESSGEKGEREGEGAEDDDGRVMRAVVGMDSTLDHEDEEDEYDQVAIGREGAGERTYMRDIRDAGPKINSHNSLPSLSELKNASRDRRANHYAAIARLKEDDEEAAAHPKSAVADKASVDHEEESRNLNVDKDNNELVHIDSGNEKENDSSSLTVQEMIPRTELKSIMKVKHKQREVKQDMEVDPPPLEEGCDGPVTGCSVTDSNMEKPKKRVRFEPGIKGDPAGQLEEKHDVIKVVNSRKRSIVRGVSSSDSMQNGYNRVPDYIRNPSKYIHYTLDWSNEDDDIINLQAFKDFSQLVKPSASAHLGDSSELPKSVTFIPRKKAACSNKMQEDSTPTINSETAIEDSSENSNQTGILPLGIAAGEVDETESPALGNDMDVSEQVDTINRNARVHKGTRQYRSKVKADEEMDA